MTKPQRCAFWFHGGASICGSPKQDHRKDGTVRDRPYTPFHSFVPKREV